MLNIFLRVFFQFNYNKNVDRNCSKKFLWSNEFEKHILNSMTVGFLAVVLVGVCVWGRGIFNLYSFSDMFEYWLLFTVGLTLLCDTCFSYRQETQHPGKDAPTLCPLPAVYPQDNSFIL